MTGEALIRLRGAACKRGARQLFSGVDLDVHAGERLALLGPNGAGKSTLLHAMVGLIPLSSGHIEAFGQDARTEADFMAARARIGLLFQDPDDQLFSPTVIEDVMFGPLNLGWTGNEARDHAERTLAQLGISHLTDRVTHRLSGGEKRLVSLATVLAMDPDVLLLDEPTNALDEEALDRLVVLLGGLSCAMVLVTHDMPLVERLDFHPAVLRDGHLIPAEIHRHPHVHQHQHGHVHVQSAEAPEPEAHDHIDQHPLHGHDGKSEAEGSR